MSGTCRFRSRQDGQGTAKGRDGETEEGEECWPGEGRGQKKGHAPFGAEGGAGVGSQGGVEGGRCSGYFPPRLMSSKSMSMCKSCGAASSSSWAGCAERGAMPGCSFLM